jgi:hydrogenase maturation protease
MRKLLIIGIGNEMRRDDGLGRHVAQVLARRSVPGVTVFESAGEGTSLIELWKEHDQVLLIDAFSSDSTPGLLHSIDASITQVPQQLFHASSHAFGIAEAIEVSRRLDILPLTVFIYGIEGEDFGLGTGLSESVRDKINDLLEIVEEKVRELLHERSRQIP